MMAIDQPADIASLDEAFAAAERDARRLVSDLTEPLGTWRPAPDAWSIAECLDHLATGNRVYLRVMQPRADRAVAQSRVRRRPARPGLLGGWFARTLEPPVKPRFKMKAPSLIRPRQGPSLDDAQAQFLASHEEVRAFLRRYAGIDLAGVLFPNPFVRGLHFSLATGLHVLAAHERRHLWQAWRVREAAERTAAS
jgi:hypothetical protein